MITIVITQDLNLFYSLGDDGIFLTMQAAAGTTSWY